MVRYDGDVSIKLNYRLCVSRFIQCLMLMVRDRIGSFSTTSDCERWLNEWIGNYVLANPSRWEDDWPVRRPLAEANVELHEHDGQYEIIALLRPHFQFEPPAEMVRVVATVPSLRPRG